MPFFGVMYWSYTNITRVHLLLQIYILYMLLVQVTLKVKWKRKG